MSYTPHMRNFSARETKWLEELDGIELASFWQRCFAFLVDWIIVGIVFSALVSMSAAAYVAYSNMHGRAGGDVMHALSSSEAAKKFNIEIEGHSKVSFYKPDEDTAGGETIKIIVDVLVPVLYFGILLWKGKGRTPGKRLMRIRVVSIVHRHLTFWQSVERALGYGAAALEGGFGFVQFFIHPYRRCAQDRLAETIVVTERSFQALQLRSDHPLEPDSDTHRNATA